MKQQTMNSANTSFIEIGLDHNQVRNVPFEKYEKDFTLIVNDHPYKMSRIVADLLSPEISRLHFIDDTIKEYSITTSTIDEELGNEKETKNDKGAGTKRNKRNTKEEHKIMKEIIETVEKGNVLRIENQEIQTQDHDLKQKNLNLKENGYPRQKLNKEKRSFVCEIMRELGKEDYFKFLPEFSTKIAQENVFERIQTKVQFQMSEKGNERNERKQKDERGKEIIYQNNNIINKRIMKDEIDFISKHFYQLIKEETKTRENVKILDVEIIEKIVKNKNLQLENEESLLKLVNELYKIDTKYSILYEYVEFSNILETNTQYESNTKDSNIIIDSKNSSNKNQNNCSDKNKAKEEMRKFIEIFDINDLNIRIWNKIFGKFIFMKQTSNNFSCDSTNLKEVGSEERVVEAEEDKETFKRENNKINKRYILLFTEKDETKELNGIMRYLTNETKGNIHDNGTISITTNSIYGNNHNDYHPKYLVDFDESKFYYSNNEANVYICFNFKDRQIGISKYQIKSYSHGVNSYHLKNWNLEISNDGNEWEEIDQRKDCETLNGNKIIGTFEIEKEKKFGRFVRLTQTGKNWSNTNYLLLYSIEFYGELKEK